MYTKHQKTCTVCKETKTISEFYVSGTRHTGTVIYQPRCKQCYSVHYLKKWHQKNKDEKAIEVNRRKRNRTKDQEKDIRLKTRYGINLESYNNMYESQKGECKICGKHEEVLRIDHNHKTHVVRDLLCHSCNTLLGHAKEDISILNKAIEYLKEHSDKFQGNTVA